MDRIIDAQERAVAKKDRLAFLAPQHSNSQPLRQFTALVFEHEDDLDVFEPL